MTIESSAVNDAGNASVQCRLLHLYLKDVSFEAPRVPGILFGHGPPAVEYHVSNTYQLSVEASRNLGEVYDVTVHVTVKATGGDKVLFLIEVQQGGLFELKGYTAEEQETVLHTRAPEALYPYVRELVASLAHRAGFPRLSLQPIDFSARHAEETRERDVGAIDRSSQ